MNYFSIGLLRAFTKITVFSTTVLIFAGALVKSHEVGLSVPDWPTTFGKQMFAFPLSDMVGGIFYEHGHRLIASIVGFLTLTQAILFYLNKEVEPWIKKLSYFSLGIVIIQGSLGGITVLFFLPPAISIVHGVLAQTFFILTIIMAYGVSRERFLRQNLEGSPKFLLKGSIFITLMVYLQLILGAMIRHTSSGLAIPDFPTMGGLWLPDFSNQMIHNINSTLFDMNLESVSRIQVVIHFLHRLSAGIITVVVFCFFYFHLKTTTKKNISKSIWMIMLTVLVQVSLGVFTVLTERSPYITSLHVLNGAILLGLCTLLVLRTLPKNMMIFSK